MSSTFRMEACKLTPRILFPLWAEVDSRVILDARPAFEIQSGYAITFIFAADEVVASWPKIVLPNSSGVIRKVVGMETSKIKVNFAVQVSPKKKRLICMPFDSFLASNELFDPAHVSNAWNATNPL